MVKLSRAARKRQRRALGWRGMKSKNPQKDGFQRQLDLFMKFFGDFGRDKSMEEINEGLPEFFESVRAEFTPEVFEELMSRTKLNIKEKEELNLKSIENPIAAGDSSSLKLTWFQKFIRFIKKFL